MAQSRIEIVGTSCRLAAVLHSPVAGSREIVILVHGYRSSKDGPTSRGMAAALEARNRAVLRIDLSGCGESAGDFACQTISGWAQDLVATIRHARSMGFDQIDLFGSSSGGLVCLAAALLDKKIRCIALKAPVTNYAAKRRRELGPAEMALWRARGYTVWRRSDGTEHIVNFTFYQDAVHNIIRSRASAIACPVLILHGNKDRNTPLSHSTTLVKHLKQGRLLIVHDGDHDLRVGGDSSLAQAVFVDWLQR